MYKKVKKDIKKIRINIILECNSCRTNLNNDLLGVSRYLTHKNRSTNNYKIELKKYCKFCNTHTVHIETK